MAFCGALGSLMAQEHQALSDKAATFAGPTSYMSDSLLNKAEQKGLSL